MRSFRRLRGAIVLLWLTGPMLLLASCSSSSSSPGALTNVTLALDYTPNTNHTGIYVAMEKGYYRQQGLNVTLLPYGTTPPEVLVGSGQAEFGISFQEYVAVNRVQGQPIVSIAAIIQHNTSELSVLTSSGITSPAQLVNKRLASFSDPAEQGVIDEMEVFAGATNPSYQTITFAEPDIKNLQTGSADFIWIYEGVEGVQARDAGVNLTSFLLQDYGVPDFYSPVLITNEHEIAQHPNIVRAFDTATAAGYTYATQHPKESADILLSAAQAQGGTLFDTPQVAYDSQTYQSQAYSAGAQCWGTQSLGIWTNFTRFLYLHGVLTDANNQPITTEPNYAAMYTNQFLPPCP